MLKDITIGQYFPGKSAVHKIDGRVKIILTIIFIAMLFISKNIYGLSIGIAYTCLCYVISQIPVKMILKSLKPLMPIIVFTMILNLFFIKTGTVYWEWKVIKITSDGVNTSVFMTIRILCLIIGTSLLTYTTSPIDLTDSIEKLLSPLKKIKVPVHELAMMMTIALRFIPTLIEETDKIISAQKARGADLETGSLIKRAKALMPVLIPLFVSSFRRAEDLALAMECRCYHGGEGRTRMKQMKITNTDYIAVIMTLMFTAGVIFINIITKK